MPLPCPVAAAHSEDHPGGISLPLRSSDRTTDRTRQEGLRPSLSSRENHFPEQARTASSEAPGSPTGIPSSLRNSAAGKRDALASRKAQRECRRTIRNMLAALFFHSMDDLLSFMA